MLTREEAIELFERRRRAWLAGDLDAYLALFHDSLVFQSPAHVEPLRGRRAFAELVRASFAAAKPVSFDFDHLAVDGDIVLAEWRIAIESRDTGGRVAWAGMSRCAIRDGLITEWREFWNPADLFPADG